MSRLLIKRTDELRGNIKIHEEAARADAGTLCDAPWDFGADADFMGEGSGLAAASDAEGCVVDFAGDTDLRSGRGGFG